MLWDIFCRVIDNYGDIGVSWRLCADLAARGERIRLWVDDASALKWMAPGALQGQWPGVQVLEWEQANERSVLSTLPPADAWIESFGCEIPQPFIAHFAQALKAAHTRQPVWLNLEYLSAESYVERSHGLPSPVMQGPAAGWTKTFFYPGFTARTGGLLREPGLMAQIGQIGQMHQAAHDRTRPDFLAQLGVQPGPALPDACLVSLFCYEPPLLDALLHQWVASPTPMHLLVTAGRATVAVRTLVGATSVRENLHIHYLPTLSQMEYDRLLWSCDINCVRGEDSVVRAIWAGKPFVWHIYPQHDSAHAAKLEAFLQQLQLGATVCHLHRAWNGLLPQAQEALALQPLTSTALRQWQQEVQTARERLLKMEDLGTALLHFALKNR